MAHFLDVLRERVLLCDGAMGSRVQAMSLDVERDFLGKENCTEILTRSRPDVVRAIHMGYLEAGSDVIQTNTFGGSPVTLGEFGLEDEAFELNKRAAELAREAIDAFRHDGRTRFVLGSIGPGTKLPTLGHVTFAELRDAYRTNAEGLIAGGVDALIVETCQDLLQVKAAVIGARRAVAEAGRDVPIIAQVTVETNGALLLGSEIGAALTAIEPLGVDVIGLNCATGPAEMSEHLRYLAKHSRLPLSCMPNAGLPELTADGAYYPLTPAELAELAVLMRRLTLATPLRQSRRVEAAARGRRVDLRTTLRRAQRTGGYPVRLARRRLRLRRRRLVVLCDISGSMEPYARAMLQLLYSAVASGVRTEVFTFATRLTRLTPVLTRVSPEVALARAGRAAPDWSGGTRIGEALATFLARYGARGMARGAVVLIISDGWETGDAALLGRQMARLSRLAYRIVWANPRTAAPGYQPLVAGMAAAWPYCDAVVSAHSLAALDDLLTALATSR